MNRKQSRVFYCLLPLSSLILLTNACQPIDTTAVVFNPGGDGNPIDTIPTEFLPTDDIVITDAAYGGTGCPQGSVSYIISPERDTISVFFDQYHAVSDESGGTIFRKTCNIGVGVQVPQGLSVSLIAMDYRGYVYVPAGGKAELITDYFFAGSPTGTQFTYVWSDLINVFDQNFNVRDEFMAAAVTWSGCGEDVILRANTSIKAYSNEFLEPSMVQVDSLDASSQIVYRLQWRSCTPDQAPTA